MMRPIVREYQLIAALGTKRSTRGLSRRLARVNETRSKLVARMDEIEDYMNWFEATQLEKISGVFADYLKTVGETSSEKVRRRDALSVYLDALDAQF
jgi:hypothetical protein